MIKHTKLTPKNLSQVAFRNRVAWLSHMQSNNIARRKPIRIVVIHGNKESNHIARRKPIRIVVIHGNKECKK